MYQLSLCVKLDICLKKFILNKFINHRVHILIINKIIHQIQVIMT